MVLATAISLVLGALRHISTIGLLVQVAITGADRPGRCGIRLPYMYADPVALGSALGRRCVGTRTQGKSKLVNKRRCETRGKLLTKPQMDTDDRTAKTLRAPSTVNSSAPDWTNLGNRFGGTAVAYTGRNRPDLLIARYAINPPLKPGRGA